MRAVNETEGIGFEGKRNTERQNRVSVGETVIRLNNMEILNKTRDCEKDAYDRQRGGSYLYTE